VEIAVDYFDEGKGDFSIIYDSSDAAVKVVAKLPGACKEAGKFKLTDTNKWKTFVCRVNDAKFAGRGGADIRLDIASGDARPVIGAVGIRKINGC
jgi:hypothetical protein